MQSWFSEPDTSDALSKLNQIAVYRRSLRQGWCLRRLSRSARLSDRLAPSNTATTTMARTTTATTTTAAVDLRVE